MEDKFFDEHIRKELEKFQVDSQDNHWDELSDRLDLEFGSLQELEKQVEFDTEIQSKLYSHSVSFNPLHWKSLKQRLDLEDDRVRKVYVSKIFEFTLFILLAIFFLQIYQKESHFAIESEDTDSQALVAQQQIIEDQSLISQKQTLFQTENELNGSAEVPPVDSQQAHTSSVISEESSLATNSNARSVLMIASLAPVQMQIHSVTSFSLAKDHYLNYADQKLINTRHDVAALDELTRLELASLSNNQGQFIIPAARLHTSKTAGRWLNISASYDANLLNETVFAVLDPDSLTGSYGASYNISYSVQRNHFEFEAGLGYSNKKIPINQTQISGNSSAYFRSSVINSQLHVAQVPFLAKYHFRPQSRFGLYVGTGINLNILMHSEELVRDQNLDFPKPGSWVGVPETNKSFVEELSQEGLLEGGRFVDNAYLSVNFLLGLQARLTPSLATYLQPGYQQHIFRDKLGPNEDKIHVLSLQLGTKFRF